MNQAQRFLNWARRFRQKPIVGILITALQLYQSNKTTGGALLKVADVMETTPHSTFSESIKVDSGVEVIVKGSEANNEQ